MVYDVLIKQRIFFCIKTFRKVKDLEREETVHEIKNESFL